MDFGWCRRPGGLEKGPDRLPILSEYSVWLVDLLYIIVLHVCSRNLMDQ